MRMALSYFNTKQNEIVANVFVSFDHNRLAPFKWRISNASFWCLFVILCLFFHFIYIFLFIFLFVHILAKYAELTIIASGDDGTGSSMNSIIFFTLESLTYKTKMEFGSRPLTPWFVELSPQLWQMHSSKWNHLKWCTCARPMRVFSL